MRHTTSLRIRRLAVLPALGLAALTIAACGSSSSHTSSASPTTAASTSTTAASTSAGGGSSSGGSSSGSTSGGSSASGGSGSSGSTSGGGSSVTTAPSSGGATGVSPCLAGTLSVSLGEETGAAGTAGVPVVFRNNGRGTCTLSGYPGVDGVVGSAAPVAATRTSSGTSIRRITLQPGDSASALVTASNMPTGSATSCPAFTALLVTPPNTRTTSHLPGALRFCSGLQVHPVVAGTSGS